MTENIRARKIRRMVVYSLATVVFGGLLLGLLNGMKPMLLPLVLGVFLAYLFKPVANSFRGNWVSKYSRALVFMFIIGSVFYWGARLVKESLPDKREKLELKVRLQYRFNERYQNWMGLANNEKGNFVYKWLGSELDPLKNKVVEQLKLTEEERQLFLIFHQADKENEISSEKSDRYYEYYVANLKAQQVDIEKLKAAAKEASPVPVVNGKDPEKNTLATLMKTFTNWIIFPLAFIFILLDKGQILHFFMSLIPNRYFELTYTVIEHVDEALGKYIRGTMLECLLVGLTLIIGFYLCGIEFKIAFMIGAIGGLTNAIPFVGTFIACIIGAVYSLIAENIDPLLPFVNENNLMIAVIAVVMIAHLLDNAIFQPLVVGSAVNIHPLVVILGVFGGSLMFGFAGLIFAIPTIVVLKVVTETFFTGLKDYRII